MVPYSARLVRMVAALVVLTLLGLVTAAWWQRSAQTAAGSVFRPEERISRIEALVALMGQAQPQGTDTAAVPAGVQPLEQSCAWRLRALMQARLMARLGLDAVASDQWLRQAWLAAHAKVGHEIRCADFAVTCRGRWAVGRWCSMARRMRCRPFLGCCRRTAMDPGIGLPGGRNAHRPRAAAGQPRGLWRLGGLAAGVGVAPGRLLCRDGR